MKKLTKRILIGSAVVGVGALTLLALPAGAITSSYDDDPAPVLARTAPERTPETSSTAFPQASASPSTAPHKTAEASPAPRKTPAPERPAPRESPAADFQEVSVPAYFYPGDTWEQLLRGGPGTGMTIANPHNGPGDERDPRYTEVLERAEAAGMDVIGYVSTGYFGTSGDRTRSGSTSPEAWMKQIKADIDDWYELYGDTGVDGIFFDEGTSRCGPGNADVERYTALREYVENAHGEEAVVVHNPGTRTEECYLESADTLVTFEGSGADYRDRDRQAWEEEAPADKIWHLVYDVQGEKEMREMLALSRERNAGHVYVTTGTLSSSVWDELPPQRYWKDQLALASKTAMTSGDKDGGR
ncbi:spherulation-specific family 4 protein [Streptomyces cyaneofuscatus]|uniref:spherulation-specific family 4 protein n=1 Tax=Streptomyces cyaneofuscatus TaxID=66883 RepID=UPI0036AAFB83